ncbi:pirin family protein [Desulfitobacterium metallireducens]|uniref:Pirin n=1 Tax=Desulfitobacterium metallireducens DSM 15288 TaxID=871968 RepID=W0EAF0_9FIRM|nr:pirin family protein [Desulfitobacterium metallireducens]AHF06513.1 pirin [Desulfitobacterium metallireducens DSM 15288]
MSNIRTINKIITGERATDGAGVKLVRVIGYDDTQDFDPFLMMDAFDSVNPNDYTKGFPWHPHRGIETVTYLIKGDIEHGDNLGNKGSILDGDCQWMTAGSGIIHQEMPKRSEWLFGVQLWLNLPAKDKMVSPQYRGIQKHDIPIVDEEDSKVHIIAGNYKGIPGALEGDYVKPLYFDVEVKKDREWTFETEEDSTLFIYILQGEGFFDPQNEAFISEKHAVLFNKGKDFRVKASNQGIRFLLLSGKPLKEPIAWGGPIVMNTREELDLAFKELNENKFVK